MSVEEVARTDMEEKYSWACASASAVKLEIDNAKPGVLNPDPAIIKAAFWSFLQAYQQIRFYHGRWIAEIGKKGQGNQYMDAWKAKFLSSNELIAWESLNQLRNDDTHARPVLPDISIRPLVLRINDKKVLGINGKVLAIGKHAKVVVHLAGIEYKLSELVGINLTLLRRFIDTFDQVS